LANASLGVLQAPQINANHSDQQVKLNEQSNANASSVTGANDETV
jgi:hypothetical protein